MITYTINSTSVISRCMRCIGVMIILALMMPAIAFSQYGNPAPVPLLTAGTYGALAYSGITGSATVNGDIGTVTATIDGSIIPTGTNWNVVDGSHNTQAQTDLAAAITNASGRGSNATIADDALDGLVLTRGVYSGGALNLSSGTTLTLTGTSTDVFIIKATSTLTLNTTSNVTLAGSVVWSNVYWYVGVSATISGTTFSGIVLAGTSITASATTMTGQLLANTGAVTITGGLLPVELTTFTGAINNNAVVLNWNTATEVNNYGFEVQRSSSSGVISDTQNYTWTNVGFVYGSGNSNSPKNYSFVDTTVSYGSYAYRLKQIDDDGAYVYSFIIEVNTGQISSNFKLSQNFPNPFNPSTQIQFAVTKNTYASLTLFNVLGEKISTPFNGNVVAGQVYNVIINGAKLASGIYFYQLKTNEKTESKKMILMK